MPRISNFLGQVSDADTDDLPAGAAQKQKNVSTTTAGELRVRGGIRPQTLTTTTISASAYHTFQKLCYCKTRSGDLIAVNGIDRGFRWDGVTTTVESLGITAPAAAPTITRAELGASDKGDGIDAIADNSGLYQITSDASHGLSNGDKVRIGNVVGSGAMANDLNNQEFTIESASGSVFSLTSTTFDGTYDSGKTGTWSKSSDVSDASADGYGATAGDYVFGYRYIDDTATAVPSSMSALTTVTALTSDQFTWGGLSSTTEARAQNKVELWRGTSGVSNVLYKVETLAYGSIGSGFVDQLDDATLNESAATDAILILTNPPIDNSLVARRFEPPPDDRPVVVQYQDRYFYLGTVKYNRSTVTTNGSTTVQGESGETDWVSTMAGRYIDIDGEPAPIEIASVTDGDTLVLVTAAQTSASDKNYVIYPEASNSRQVDFSEPDQPESVPVVNVFTVQEQAGDDDDIVGAMTLGSSLFLLGNRHKYSFSFTRKPLKDGTVRYVEDRGVFNHDCWDVYENKAYMMDDTGPYIFTGGASQPIGSAIKDLWRKDGTGDTIDFAKTASFHVKVDRAKARAYFFVCFTGDSGTQPTRALVYNIRRQSWDVYHYPQKIGAAATVQSSGETRFLLGSESAAVHMADAGNADILSAEVTGTATAGSTTTLTDSGASFATAVVGAPIYIYEGTGKGQIRTITARTGTQVTVATWTAPDTTSKYIIGAIEWNWKSTSFGFPQDGVRHERRVGLKFTPTTGDQRIDLRLYFNGSSTVHTFETGQVLGDAVEIQEDNKSDVVFFMKIERSAMEDSSGAEAFRFDGTYSRLAHGDHKVAIELRGYAGDEVQKIQQLDIEGVEGKN
jgi:hypothetical protein